MAFGRAAARPLPRGSAPRLAQRPFDRVEHLARPEWLAQKAEGLRELGAMGRLLIGQAGQEDRRNPEFLPQQAGQFDAIDRAGQPDVDEGETRPGFLCERQRLGPRGRDAGNAKARFRQHFLDIAGDKRFILDDQNARRLACAPIGDHFKIVTWHRPLPAAVGGNPSQRAAGQRVAQIGGSNRN